MLLQVNVQQRFQRLGELLAEHYTDEDRQIVACPRQEQVSGPSPLVSVMKLRMFSNPAWSSVE